MTISLRKVAATHGFTGQVFVCSDLLGFEGGHLPGALVPTRPRPQLSLKQHVQLFRTSHFDVHLIFAGSDLLTTADHDAINYAIFRMRTIYYANGIGVGRVSWQMLTVANSSGHATVTTEADIASTGTDLTADGAFVPVVIPANMNVTTTAADGSVSVTLGKSPVRGPCTPRNGTGMRSAVVAIAGEGTGRSLAHEVGHYLGAPHPGTADNSLMTQTGSVTSGDPFNAVTINNDDRKTMVGHCAMKAGSSSAVEV
jgi:hypothetical protein